MACIVMACIVMACIVMACIVMACVVMACIAMAHIVMAYTVMAYVVMACIVMALSVIGRWNCSRYLHVRIHARACVHMHLCVREYAWAHVQVHAAQARVLVRVIKLIAEHGHCGTEAQRPPHPLAGLAQLRVAYRHWLDLGVTDSMSIARVWACWYSKSRA